MSSTNNPKLKAGIAAAKRAVAADSEGDLSLALQCYKEAAQALIDGIGSEQNSKYTNYINQYVSRAEAIELELAKRDSSAAHSQETSAAAAAVAASNVASAAAACDAQDVQIITDLGFRAAQAREALSMFDNDLERATSYLFDAVSQPTQSSPSSSPPEPISEPTALVDSPFRINMGDAVPGIVGGGSGGGGSGGSGNGGNGGGDSGGGSGGGGDRAAQPPKPPQSDEAGGRGGVFGRLFGGRRTSSGEAERLQQEYMDDSPFHTIGKGTDGDGGDDEGDGDGGDVEGLRALLKAASVDDQHTCRCTLFTNDGAVCGKPTATGCPICWQCKYTMAVTGVSWTTPDSVGIAVTSRPGVSEAERLRAVVDAALISDVKCEESLFTPDGTICGRPAAWVKAAGSRGDGTANGARSICWNCKRIKALTNFM